MEGPSPKGEEGEEAEEAEVAAAEAEVEPAAAQEVVRPELEPGPAAPARLERARAVATQIRPELDHPHPRARQATANAVRGLPARESATPVQATPIDLAHAKAGCDASIYERPARRDKATSGSCPQRSAAACPRGEPQSRHKGKALQRSNFSSMEWPCDDFVLPLPCFQWRGCLRGLRCC
jgi:hypothetical protein